MSKFVIDLLLNWGEKRLLLVLLAILLCQRIANNIKQVKNGPFCSFEIL